jgi:hypothetical protein
MFSKLKKHGSAASTQQLRFSLLNILVKTFPEKNIVYIIYKFFLLFVANLFNKRFSFGKFVNRLTNFLFKATRAGPREFFSGCDNRYGPIVGFLSPIIDTTIQYPKTLPMDLEKSDELRASTK